MSRTVGSLVLLLAITSFYRATAAAVQSNKEKSDKLFCTGQGGELKEYSMWNGNAPGYKPVGIKIAKPMAVCSFKIEQGTNAYEVTLDTLTSVQPTLAVLAYQSRIKPIQQPTTSSPTSPSACSLYYLYCSQLVGTYTANAPTAYLPDSTVRVGWWTKLYDGSWYGVNDFCIFADGSAAEIGTLLHHATYNNTGGVIKFAYTRG